MAKNQDNIRGWDGELSAVYLAPKNTTLPELTLEIPPLFEEVGYISDGGLESEVSVETRETKAWQGNKIVKVKPTGTKKSHKFAALEESPFVTGMYLGHGKPTKVGSPGAEIARVDLPESIPMIEKAMIIKTVDGDRVKLQCFELVSVSERGTVAAKGDEDTIYEFTFVELGPSFWLTNDPAYLEAATP